ncbi:AAA family ATPase [Prosthecobacter sp.]|uniref:AAA family ATPase n=1 Tax=Prosthecobacter sp. TaxID=1965333 RepID=UPI0037852DFA
MSQSNTPQGEQGKRRPFLVENVYEKETTESFIERHFRDRTLHRCRCVAEFDVDVIAEQYGADLARSGQELEPDPVGKEIRAYWTMMLFRRSERSFWLFMIKSNSSYGAKEREKEYTLTVTADSPRSAAEDAMMLRKHFTASDDAPGFFLVTDVRRPKRIPLKPEYALSDEMLNLHYGADFAEWCARFGRGLGQSGLSILRGKPGTGKTSFLRHLIYSLTETHRFYYLPVDSFGLLRTNISDFLANERRRFKDAVLVLVLEDAEQLLLDRHDLRDGLASSLLNFTDGFIGDIVQAHLICTINSEVKDLDAAVLRPGRQRFFREFDLLDWERAAMLAEKLGVRLSEERPYSLAELYHFKDVQNTERMMRHERTIGFSVE